LYEGPRALVIATGSELVRGDRRDENGPFLARELSARGVEPARLVIVGDRPAELAEAIRHGLAADLCIVSGGLGPTHDDRTVEALAAETGRPLHVDPKLEREIEDFSRAIAERLGRPYADFATGVRKQAALPEGAVSLGLAGTAPALLLEHEGTVVVVLPGPPAELRRLWARALGHPAVKAVLARAPVRERRVLRLFGPSESAVALALEEAGGEVGSVEVTVCARDLEIHVDLFYPPEARRAASRLADALTAAFPDQLFAVDDERSAAALVLDAARAAGKTIVTAESSTGGLIAARLTDVPGASEAYLGGVVAYSDELKKQELHVPDDTLRKHGAVSAETAVAMADGARARFGGDVAVSVTGIAGPSGGSPEKPVGLVYIGVAGPTETTAERFQLPGDRDTVRARTTALALHRLRRVLTQMATSLRGDAR
jgi:nicotinamide-nucleotide amidase